MRVLPQRYPPMPPAEDHAMAGDDQADGIGRAGPGHGADRLGLADRRATSAYARVSPYGIRCSARHTFHWKAVACTSIGRSSAGRSPRRCSLIALTHSERGRSWADTRPPNTRVSDRGPAPCHWRRSSPNTRRSRWRPPAPGRSARHDRIRDPHACAMTPVSRERHALAGRRGFVDAARRAIARFVNRGRHVTAVPQTRAQLSARTAA